MGLKIRTFEDRRREAQEQLEQFILDPKATPDQQVSALTARWKAQWSAINDGIAQFKTNDPLMLRRLEAAKDIAATKYSVLVTGPTGTGKEIISRMMHGDNITYERFIAVNIAAIPESLFEGQLFGFRRGSFTGAAEDRKGFIALANEGTLFLDEIGVLPLPFQAKLLRVLETGEYWQIGADKPSKSDFRLVCATNRDLRAMSKDGTFLHDLYARISTFEIKITGLEQRPGDIPLILSHLGCEQTPPASRLPDIYQWNVRELKKFAAECEIFGHLEEDGEYV